MVVKKRSKPSTVRYKITSEGIVQIEKGWRISEQQKQILRILNKRRRFGATRVQLIEKLGIYYLKGERYIYEEQLLALKLRKLLQKGYIIRTYITK